MTIHQNHQGRVHRAPNPSINLKSQTMIYLEPQPTNEVKAVTAELFDHLALNAGGQPFTDSDPSTWQAAYEVEAEVVRLGLTTFHIVDPDATGLALAACAIDENSPPTLCMRVRFENTEDQPQRRSGQYVTINTEVGVKLVFMLSLTGEDVHDPAPEGFDLDSDALRNEALDVLQPGEALLVQVQAEVAF